MRESAGMLWVLGICTVELFSMLVFLNYFAAKIRPASVLVRRHST